MSEISSGRAALEGAPIAPGNQASQVDEQKNIIYTACISSGSKGGEAHLILIITEKNEETLPKFTFPARCEENLLRCQFQHKCRNPKLDCKKKMIFVLRANTCVCLSCDSFFSTGDQNGILVISSARTAISCELKRINQHDFHFEHE